MIVIIKNRSHSLMTLSLSYSLNVKSRLTGSDLQVHDRRASLFLDGLEEDGTPFDTQRLSARLSDVSEDVAMWVGLSSKGESAYTVFEGLI